ncbi:MAG: quinolinate synthase NadA [Oscillospiraceae bacterium]|nr:quinolinate synthase NadA [Oscillospiraceae bacterium]
MTDLQRKIRELKEATGALILAHYYQTLDVQDVADVVGDSYEMAKRARDAEESTIVVCGVKFMAESAKILSPEKTVLLPAPDAGCPMADMVEPEDVLALRAKHPNAVVMCYVNSSAAVKAVSDICCTSSSAIRIAKSLDADEIIFVPDRNLGRYVAEYVPEKQFYFHPGFCPIHDRVTVAQVQKAKERYPNALVTAHPECREDVLKLADFIGSTSQIIGFARETDAEEIIIGTEIGVLELLQRELPQKKILSVSASFVCPNMKKTTLQDVYNALATGSHEIRMTPEEIQAAKQSLDRMIAL